MPNLEKYSLTVFLIILCFGIALANSETSLAQQEPKGGKSESIGMVMEPASGPAENKDLVRILTRLPQFSLTDQTGKKFALHHLYGHVWVANFVFTRCQDTCPLQTAILKKLQDSLKESENWENTRLVSISVDPEHDTPGELSKYIQDKNLETSQWHFLTGTREAIWNLTKIGFKLPVGKDSRNSKMPILHSTQFVLVDWEGRIRGYYNALEEEELGNLKRDIARVTFERVVVPAEAANPEWVENRRQKQLQSATDFDVFKDFKFTDELAESGIRFRHKIVDDAGREYKAVHYDHGNAIAVADVDMDGRYDIYFTSQVGTNELWRNLGNGKFENITESAGLNIVDRIGVGASFGDIDNDGDPDLYITNVRVGNMLFENDGKGHFRNISEHSGTDLKAHSSGSVFFDYDRDGLLDLFVTNVGVYTTDTVVNASVYTDFGQVIGDQKYYVGHKDAFAGHLKPERTETSVLFRNKGNNRFEDVSAKVNLVDSSWSGDATVIDGNDDGWPDLYVLNMQGNDEYYENVDGKRFVRKSRELFPKTPWGSMGIKSFDFDNDGDMDIFVTDMHSDMAEKLGPDREKMKMEKHYPESMLQSGGNSLFGNAFYLNEGDARFSEVSDRIGAENYWPWGLSSGDLNSDGFEDVFIASSMNYPFRYGVNSLLLNDKGKGFLDSEYVLGIEPRKNGITAAPWFEVNCSGRDAGGYLCGTSRGRRVIWSALGSRSSVIFDLDQDGDQDIVTLEFNQSPMVLVSNLSDRRKLNYLKVKLIGKASNKSGVGARVKVFSGDDIYTKYFDGKSGYLSQSSFPLYFGLGEKTKVDKIEVTWPSGKSQVLEKKLKSNGLLEIEEPN